MNPNDVLWPEFKPLWSELHSIETSLLVAGGYGLFLKQDWLTKNTDTPVVIAIEKWKDRAPRVTKDLDLVISLDLIAEQHSNQTFAKVLSQQGYSATERNPRWQFEKKLSLDRSVIVDLHAPYDGQLPPGTAEDRVRVKHKPSLGDSGVQGRKNPEAAGCELHPFRFAAEDLTISVPNPVTWSIMKLIAMRDCSKRSGEANRLERDRNFWRAQATKHAQDVCRVVAMVTLSERDQATDIAQTINQNAAFIVAKQIFAEYFGDEANDGIQHVKSFWEQTDLKLIQGTLAEWFR